MMSVVLKIVLLMPIFLILNGCVSISSSTKDVISLPLKTNEQKKEVIYNSYPKPYTTSIEQVIKDFLNLNNFPSAKFVVVNKDDKTCRVTKSSENKLSNATDDAYEMVVTVNTVDGVAKGKPNDVIATFSHEYVTKELKAIPKSGNSITVGDVIVGTVYTPTIIVGSAIFGTFSVVSGHAFRDKEPEKVKVRASLVASESVDGDKDNYYMLLDVVVKQRKDKLLYQVNTPSSIYDWKSEERFKLLIAIDAENDNEAMLGLCGKTM